MNNLMLFEGNKVEIFELNGTVYFNPYEVGGCLGLTDSAVKMAISKMTDKQVRKLTNSKVKDIDFRKLHNTGENFLTESGMYKLAFRSNKPEAERFTNWVADEVLPSIRKTGRYEVVEEDPEDLLSKALLYVNSKLEAKEAELEQKKHEIAELKPKASYYDLILQCPDLLSVSQISKDYGMSAVTMNKKLHELGIQYKKSGQWLLYQKYADEGYTYSKTQHYNRSDGSQGSSPHTYWTQKGRQFLYDFLKEHDILPKIEQMELVRV